MLQQVQALQAQLKVNNRKLANIEKKGGDQAFAKTWQESAMPETQDPIGRVVALMETQKIEDSQEHYVKLLKAEKAAGKATLSMLGELSKSEAAYNKRLREFSCGAPPYDGNPNKVFDWCGELEKHLSRHQCEKIPNDTIKRMLLDCITGKAQSEIVLLRPDGLAPNVYA